MTTKKLATLAAAALAVLLLSAFGAPWATSTVVSLQAINPASCAASSVCLTSVTVSGAAAGDACLVTGPSATLAGVAFACYASATNTVQLQVLNPTTSAKDQASGTFTFWVIR